MAKGMLTITDGTSQGLFVVVAIVIFGIFVSLSYTVFGNMGDGTVNLFENALSTVVFRSNNFENYNWVVMDEIDEMDMINEETEVYRNTPRLVLFRDEASQDKVFRVAFELELVDGVLEYIGGHNHMSDLAELKINGKQVPISQRHGTAWTFGVPIDLEVGETIHIEYTFKATLYDNQYNDNPNKHVSIEPGRRKASPTSRLLPKTEFHAVMRNLQVFEGFENIED